MHKNPNSVISISIGTGGKIRIYPRFSKSEWDMLNRVSQKTNRLRTELVREAVDEYLRESL